MYLTYVSTVTGETKRIDLVEFNQDKTALWFTAEAYSKFDYYTINRYMNLWHNDKCIGTQVQIVK